MSRLTRNNIQRGLQSYFLEAIEILVVVDGRRIHDPRKRHFLKKEASEVAMNDLGGDAYIRGQVSSKVVLFHKAKGLARAY